MKVRVNLHNLTNSHPNFFGNDGNVSVTLEGDITLDALIRKLKLHDTDHLVILKNGTPVPLQDQPGLPLEEDDQLTIFPMMEGG